MQMPLRFSKQGLVVCFLLVVREAECGDRDWVIGRDARRGYQNCEHVS